jgi:hypothetical protein
MQPLAQGLEGYAATPAWVASSRRLGFLPPYSGGSLDQFVSSENLPTIHTPIILYS